MGYSEWKEYKLGELAKTKWGFVDGPFGSNLPASDYVEFGIPVIRGVNLSKGLRRFKDDKFIFVSDATAKRLERSKCYSGDIIFTKKGTLGQIGIIPKDSKYKEYLLSSNQMKLTVNNDLVDNEYVYYYLSSKISIEKIIQDSEHTGVPKINLSYLKSFPIKLPILNSQKNISLILSSLDEKIELNRLTNQTLEAIAQTLFKEMCVPKSDILGEGWSLIKLADIVDVTSSKRIFREEYILSGIPFYRGKEITQLSKGANISTELFISEERYNKIKKGFGIPKIGDLLITSVGTIGSVWLVDDDLPFYFKDGNVTWVKNYNSEIDGDYIFQWLKTKSAIDQIKSVTIGSTQEALTISALKGLEIIIPDKVIISKVIVQLKAINSMRVLNVEETQTLIKLRDSLLPKLMKGEIKIYSKS